MAHRFMQVLREIARIIYCYVNMPYNSHVRCTSLLSTYSSVRRIVLLRITHTLLGRCALQWTHVSQYTGNMQFDASKVLHENGDKGRAVYFQYVAHHLASFIT